MLLVSLPGVAFMVGTSDLLIPALLGLQWAGASPIFAALGAAAFLQVLNNPTGWLFISQGRTQEYFRWGLFGSATSVASFVAGLPYGPLGVAAAYAASECARTPILWWYVTRRGPIHPRDVARTAAPHFAGVLACWRRWRRWRRCASCPGVRCPLWACPSPPRSLLPWRPWQRSAGDGRRLARRWAWSGAPAPGLRRTGAVSYRGG